MSSLHPLVIILFGHWVGDYLFQTNKMAQLKSSSIHWLSIHALVYTLTLTLFSFLVLPLEFALQFSIMNGAIHWMTDFFTSKLSSKYRGRPRIFFPILGFDQFIHSITLVMTLEIWLKI